MRFVNTLQKYFSQFLRAKTNSELSEHTICAYRFVLSKFLSFADMQNKRLKGRLSEKHIDEDFFFDFLDWLSKDKEMKNTTKKAYLIRIKVFLKYIEKKSNKKILLSDKLEDIKIKTPSLERKHLTRNEQQCLMDYFSYLEGVDNKSDIQKVLIAKLLMFTGIRAIELRRLEVQKFILNTDGLYEFTVLGKGNKERICYLKADIIEPELENFKQTGKKFICETRTGKPMSHAHLWKTIASIFEEAGINKTGAHLFRHSYARYLVSIGTNLSVVKEMLGHNDIKTTQIYAKADENAKRQVAAIAFLNI